jgi:predicted Na+-dependent transporter
MSTTLLAAILLQGVPPRALVMAMLLSYFMCFAGMIFAYLNYRRRQKGHPKDKDEENKK